MTATHGMSNPPYRTIPTLFNFLYPFLVPDKGVAPDVALANFLQHAGAERRSGRRGLYVHIPFCDTICTFCPFLKSANYEPVIDRYVQALLQEIERVGSYPLIQGMEFSAIYVGGGTPSVMSPEMIERVCRAIRTNFRLAAEYEWTFECEAKTALDERLAAMVAGGVNRGSFGVQSFSPRYREMFNLTATIDEICCTSERMNRYFRSCNMDLLYQLPGQSIDELVADLEQSMHLGTSTIDAYPLEYLLCSKGFLRNINRAKLPQPPSPAEKIEMTRTLNRLLKAHGWRQNYVYTFNSPRHRDYRFAYGDVVYGGYEDECVALGAGAISYLQGMTYQNAPDTHAYIDLCAAGRLPVVITRHYHAYERGLIYLPKALKQSRAYLEGLPLSTELWAKLESLVQRGLVVERGDTLMVTEEALPWYICMMVELIPESERLGYERFVARLQQQHDWYEPVTLEVQP